jgi:hypothetical protein
VWLTVGGDRIDYPGEVATKMADLTATNSILNSTLPTKHVMYMNMDMKNYYIGTPMMQYEYMKIQVRDIQVRTMIKYILYELVYKS